VVFAEQGLIGYWSFNEGSGTVAKDSSGNNNDGTLVRGPVWVAGKYGNALKFDAAQKQKVEIPNSASFATITSALTISGWVNLADLSGWKCLMAKGDLAYSMFVNPSGAVRMHYDGNNVGGNSVDSVNDIVKAGEWTHLLGTYDGKTIQIYVNGVVKLDLAANTAPIPVITNTLTIGGTAESRDWMNGMIDEVRLYNRAFTAAEVRSIMESTTAVESVGKIAVTWGAIRGSI